MKSFSKKNHIYNSSPDKIHNYVCVCMRNVIIIVKKNMRIPYFWYDSFDIIFI